MIEKVNNIVKTNFQFDKFEEVGSFFKRLIYIIQQFKLC